MSSWGEIVLRACFRPLDEQVVAFRGRKLAHVPGDVGRANEIPECAIFEVASGHAVVAFRDLLPDDEPDGFEDNPEWTLIGERKDWEAAKTWGELNAPHGGLFLRAWREAWEAGS